MRNCQNGNSAFFTVYGGGIGKISFRIKYEKDKKNICKGLTKGLRFAIISIVENDGPLRERQKEEKMTGRIHSFESFGTVDGPGIRFVIFLQGCPLRCQYCHNPDTWGVGGEEYSVQDVVQRAIRYKNYFGDKGGVTVTGGEPLLQIDFVIELLTELKKKGIHTCIDTSGIMFHPNDELSVEKHKQLLSVTDLVLLDIKHIDDEACKKLTGQSNANTLAFARFLSDNGTKIWIRQVLVPGITDGDEDLKKTRAFIDSLKTVEKVEVLPYHTMGTVKYEKLGMEYPLKDVAAPTKERVMNAKNILQR